LFTAGHLVSSEIAEHHDYRVIPGRWSIGEQDATGVA
jgi:hypothetical protein